MNTKRLFTVALMMTLCLSVAGYRIQAQELAKKDRNKTLTTDPTWLKGN